MPKQADWTHEVIKKYLPDLPRAEWHHVGHMLEAVETMGHCRGWREAAESFSVGELEPDPDEYSLGESFEPIVCANRRWDSLSDPIRRAE